MSFSIKGSEMSELVLIFTVGMFVLTAILHIAIAVLVGRDAGRLKTDEIAINVAPWIWVLAALLGGVMVLGIYWAMYYSTLRRTND